MRAVRLINACDLEDKFPLPLFEDMPKEVKVENVRKAIIDTPTFDAVQVVRCKDCKYYGDYKDEYGQACCHYFGDIYTNGDWYCAGGAKRSAAE